MSLGLLSLPVTLAWFVGMSNAFNLIDGMDGVATGLAWTPSGGEILFIESSRMPGKKGLSLTGSLGDVMKESAQAALSYIRGHASKLRVPPRFFEQSDIHFSRKER